MRKFLLMIGAVLLLSTHVWAQERTVTGKVTSAEDGSPLPGVNVILRGTTTGTATDAEGRFSLSVPASGGALVFSFIGLQSKEIEIGDRSVVDVAMALDVTQLSEVVVTGYGVQSKREVTGAISSVKGEAIEKLPMQTFDRAIQGRAAGVQVVSAGGQPGGGITVNIRGVGTINGSTQPLYIVDGVQVSGGGLNGVTTSNALSSINPADIESIEILKDAAAASIYGALAGNGVVIITTKRGKAGKSKVKFSAQYGISEQYNPYNILTGPEWMNLRREAYGNSQQRKGLSYQSGVDIANNFYDDDGDPSTPVPSYDWVNAILRKGKLSQYDLSLSGGDDKTQFFISGSYNKTEGTIYGSEFTRGTIRANLTHKPTDKVTIETSLGLTGSDTRGFSTNAGFFVNTPFTGGLFIAPITPIYNEDGTYNQSLIGNSFNLVQLLKEEQRKSGTFQTVSNLAISYNIMKGLTFKAFAGVDFSDIKDYNYRPTSIPAYASTGGTGSEVFRRNLSWNTNYTLSYSKKFGDAHSVSAVAGYEYRDAQNLAVSAGSQSFASPKFTLISSGATPTTATSTFTGYRLGGYFLNAKYDYKDKYLASATFRYDGSSRFGADKRYGAFYGLSLGWRISNEAFMSGISFLSDLKLRASYGVVGVQPTADFGSLDLYGNGGAYNGTSGIRPVQLGNPNLTWEQAETINLGMDYAFLSNRIYGSVDFWQKTNSKLLLDRQLPADAGFTSIRVNLGEVQNKGIDFEVSTVNMDTKGFKWVTRFNISLQKNEITNLGPGVSRIGNSYIVGKPLGMLYTYKWAGVNPADGRPMYYDAKNQLTYIPVAADQRYMGSSIPSHYGGISNSFTYKGLSLEVFFQYQYGNETYLQAAQVLEASGSFEDNQLRSQLKRWTTPGQITGVPRPYSDGAEPGGYDPSNLSSRYIQTASYIRLKQVTLSYQLPSSIVSKTRMSNINVFVQGINLATFTNFRGDDPENAITNNLNQYPNPRQLTAGVTLEF